MIALAWRVAGRRPRARASARARGAGRRWRRRARSRPAARRARARRGRGSPRAGRPVASIRAASWAASVETGFASGVHGPSAAWPSAFSALAASVRHRLRGRQRRVVDDDRAAHARGGRVDAARVPVSARHLGARQRRRHRHRPRAGRGRRAPSPRRPRARRRGRRARSPATASRQVAGDLFHQALANLVNPPPPRPRCAVPRRQPDPWSAGRSPPRRGARRPPRRSRDRTGSGAPRHAT